MNARRIVILLLGLLPGLSLAHVGGTTYVYLDRGRDAIRLTADLDLRGLEASLALDTDRDGRLRFGEIDAAAERIAALTLERLQPSAGGTHCSLDGRQPLAIAELAEGPAARLVLSLDCAVAPLELDYTTGFRSDPLHRVLLLADDGSAAVLTADAPRWRGPESTRSLIARFFAQGGWHLATGYDHLAFLAVLLIAVVQPRQGCMPPLRRAMIEAAQVVTGFTLAHSLTLGLAATGILRLAPGPVEVAIAATVLLASLANLVPGLSLQGWRIAAGFGLVHGLGFAGALGELLGGASPLLPLGAFNLGIEAAQVAIAGVAVPLAWTLLRYAPATRAALPVASLAVAVVAASWMWERL